MKRLLIIGLAFGSQVSYAALAPELELLCAMKHKIETEFERVKDADVATKNKWIEDSKKDLDEADRLQEQCKSRMNEITEDLTRNFCRVHNISSDLKETIQAQYDELNPQRKIDAENRRDPKFIIQVIVLAAGVAGSFMMFNRSYLDDDVITVELARNADAEALGAVLPIVLSIGIALVTEICFSEPSDQKMLPILESDKTE